MRKKKTLEFPYKEINFIVLIEFRRQEIRNALNESVHQKANNRLSNKCRSITLMTNKYNELPEWETTV